MHGRRKGTGEPRPPWISKFDINFLVEKCFSPSFGAGKIGLHLEEILSTAVHLQEHGPALFAEITK